MADATGERIRVILRTIQIHDNLEPAWDDEGEFRFRARVFSRNRGGVVVETTLPGDDSHYPVSDHPARNRLYLNKVIFEGEVEDHLEVEVVGEEIDILMPNDQLERYHRVWEGDPSTWIGFYHPGDEGSTDPERMPSWGITLEIERA
jgi:hypothetical protein